MAETVPKVISLKGKKKEYGPGLEKRPDIVYIGRNVYTGGWRLPKSKWYNPFSLKLYTREEALNKYREYILNTPELLESLHELSGKTLACWCHPEPCHGDVLVELYTKFCIK
ncbi:MAG: DUF4326 domain-containing protein [Nitrososphaerota archaeon]